MSEGELESWIVVMDWMGWNNFLTCIHLFLMKVWMRKKISKIKAVTDIFFHYRSVCWFLFLDWSWLLECQKIEDVIKLFVLLLFFQLKLKYWKGCLLALIKWTPSCYSSDLFVSWKWEWSSWDLFFFSSSSRCKTRQKWTPYFMVQPDKLYFNIYHWTKGGGLFFLLCLYVSVQYLQSFPSPAWWVWPML